MKSNGAMERSESDLSKRKLRVAILGLFGISVVTSGLWRFFSAEGGHAGLWFGLVMGGLAIFAAFLFLKDKVGPALLAGWLSLVFVGGWFCYESLIKKGIENAEPRQLIIIGITFSAIGWLGWTMMGDSKSNQTGIDEP